MAMSTLRRPAGRPGAARRRERRGQTLTTVAFVIILLYFLLPLFWLIVSATKSNQDLFTSFGLWFAPHLNVFDNLRTLVTTQDHVFLRWLWNTTYYAVCSAVGGSLIATVAGYTFAKFRFPGRGIVFWMILGSMMVPGTCLAVPLYLLLTKMGLINTPLAVILPSLTNAFGVYLMRVYAEQAIPDELLEAARIDGAGEWRILWSVVMRILAPGFVTVLLFSFVGTWNNYFLPLLVLSKPELYPLTVGLAAWNASAQGMGGNSAVLFNIIIMGALVSITPLILAFLFLQRYWQAGLTFGAVKS